LTIRKRRREEGQAMVEFALMLPVLLVILLAIMQFGLMFNNYLTLTDAVRTGARQLALSRGLPATPSDPCVLAQARASAAAGSLDTSKIVYTPSFSGTDACSNSSTTWNEGDSATLAATYPYKISIMGVTFLNGTLSATATEAIE
jgi:Flp pilus assembly protein TadG